MKLCLLIGCLLSCGAIVACGNGADAGETADSRASAEASTESEVSAANSDGQDTSGSPTAEKGTLVTKVRGVSKPPDFDLPSGPPPKKVVIRDLREGRGAEIQSGDFFSATYISLNYRTGDKVVEDFWTPGPFEWYWDREQLSQGWEIGLKGMRVGGLRELLVPSELAYGDGSRAYVVELREVADKRP